MAISKKPRCGVQKFDGHCAYCGRHGPFLNNMQIDHLKPQGVEPRGFRPGGVKTLCRPAVCATITNAHMTLKHSDDTLQRFRENCKDYIYKVGVVYGNVLENPKAIKILF